MAIWNVGRGRRRSWLARASVVMMMDEGEIVELGPPEQIFGKPESPRTAEFLRRVLH